HHPDAYAFLTARVHIARRLQGELRVRCMHAAAVLVIEPAFAANEHFPQRPFFAFHDMHRQLSTPAATAFRRCLRACASAASRTQAPSCQAFTRAANRSLLHGPLPLTTAQNSLQSISPKS